MQLKIRQKWSSARAFEHTLRSLVWAQWGELTVWWMFFKPSTHSEEITSNTDLRDRPESMMPVWIYFITDPQTVYLSDWRPTVYRACVISAQARTAPWRLWRSVPTVMGSSFGRTGPNKQERATQKKHTLRCLGNRSSDIVYLFLPYNQELEGSGCRALYWRARGSRWKKSHKLPVTCFYLRDILKDGGRQEHTHPSGWSSWLSDGLWWPWCTLGNQLCRRWNQNKASLS